MSIALLAGCTPHAGGTGVKPPARPGSSVSGPLASPAATTPGGSPIAVSGSVPPVPVPSPLASQPPGGGSIIADNGSSLIGQVKGPAGLLAAAGIASTYGNGYVLLADLAEQPAAGATVSLLNASGAPVPGPGGKPLVAKTDAQGHFAFQAGLPAESLVLRVDLGSLGALQAIAPKTNATRQADIDLVSTFTTTYILDQYVRTQPHPLDTIERLPADVEATTRKLAASAITGGKTALPDSLTDDKVLGSVQSLRQENADFDAQMEAVRKLLVLAGQSDLGNGQPALSTTLTAGRLLVDPAGGLDIGDFWHSRIWRLRSDRTLAAIAGDGRLNGTSDPIDGAKALDTNIFSGQDMLYDDSNRLVVLRAFDVLRFDPDGSEHELMPGFDMAGTLDAQNHIEKFRAAVPNVGDEVLLFSDRNVRSLRPGQAPKVIYRYTPADAASLAGFAYGPLGARDAQGRIFVGPLQFDPALPGFKTSSIGQGFTSNSLASLDAYGNLFASAGPPSWGVLLQRPGGAIAPILDATPGKTAAYHGLLAPEGTTYVAAPAPGVNVYGVSDVVYRLDKGQATRIAGGADDATGANGQVAFTLPIGLAYAPDGTALVIDNNRLFKLDASQTLTPYNLTTSLPYLSLVHIDAQGTVFVADGFIEGQNARVYRLDASGNPTPLVPTGPGSNVSDFVVDDTGNLYVSQRPDQTHSQITMYPADGSASKVVFTPPLLATPSLLDGNHYAPFPVLAWAGGKLYVATADGLWAGDPGQGLTRMGTQTWTVLSNSAPGESNVAVDARGRVYACGGDKNDRIVRYDPTSDAFTTIGGPGGIVFNGSGVDDSLDYPKSPVFNAAGDLVFVDQNHKQVKRIPANQLN